MVPDEVAVEEVPDAEQAAQPDKSALSG